MIGGRDISEDRRRLSKSTAIVATLGRLLHLISNCVISIKQIKLIVLDEADKLITSDFRSNIDKLFKMFPAKPQIIASSATYADGLDKLLLAYMQNPAAVSATHEMPILIGIKHFAHVVTTTGGTKNEATTPIIKTMMCKVEAVEQILKNVSFKQCILFSNSQMRAESFSRYLIGKGWNVDLIIGSHEQQLRTSTFQKFCKFESRILIASDVMARGIDVENVNLVINLDVPADSSTYLHRIGRCGRFGTYGIAITLISDGMDMHKFEKMLENIGGDCINVSLLPTVSEIDCVRLWDFSNEQSDADASIFDKLNGVSEKKEKNGDYQETPSTEIEYKQKKIGIQEQNMELLEVGKLMLESKSQSTVHVDLDLFTDYSNHDVTLDDDIDSSVRNMMIGDDANQNHKLYRMHESDPSQHLAFLQAVKNLQIGQQSDVILPILDDSKPKNGNVSENKPDNSIFEAATMRTNAVTEHVPIRKQKLAAQNLWQSIYWQQFYQINQYSCWMKNTLPPK